MSSFSMHGTIVLLINNSHDNTLNLAKDWANSSETPVLIVDVKFPPALSHAGKARQTALGVASKCVSRQGYLLTTDADFHPYPDWVENSISPMEAGRADMVCGQIFLDPEAAERLPDLILKRGDIEEEYRTISREINQLINPDPVNS
ncbi:MAG: glycosyltransferase [Acetobacteraceae bacterium]